MSLSTAAAKNFKIFSYLGGGYSRSLRCSAAAAEKFSKFVMSRRRRLHIGSLSAAAGKFETIMFFGD